MTIDRPIQAKKLTKNDRNGGIRSINTEGKQSIT